MAAAGALCGGSVGLVIAGMILWGWRIRRALDAALDRASDRDDWENEIEGAKRAGLYGPESVGPAGAGDPPSGPF